MSVVKAPGNQAGFTLLELLISLTLLAVMTGILTGGFHLSIRAWEAGEERLDGRHEVAESVNLIKRQIKMARNVTYMPIEGATSPRTAFIGDSHAVTFVTASPRFVARAGAAGLYMQKIEFDPQSSRLLFMEAVFEPSAGIDDYEWIRMPMAESRIESLRFEYLLKNLPEAVENGEEEFIWVDTLNPTGDETESGNRGLFPVAVRFNLELKANPDQFVWPPQIVPVYQGLVVEQSDR